MAYNDFIKFATNHRNLLETAIKKYPTALKPSDLVEFDQVILETKKELRSRGLLENWKPLASFKSPEDFLHVRENELILEAISDEIKNDAKINPATRSQINAIESLRGWFDGLPADAKDKVDQFTSNFSPSKNKFTQELEDIEEKINSMYGKGDKGGVFSKAAKNIGGWLTRGMSKLTGAGRVEDTTLEEQVSINENLEETFSNANILENLMIAELFGQQMVNEGPLSPGLLTAPNVSAFVPNIQNAQRGLTAAKKALLLKQQAAQAAAAAAKTGGAAASGTGAPGATITALKGGGTGAKGLSITALKGGAGAKGAGGAAATAGKLAVLKTGLMVGGGVLAAAAVYGGWTARDTRKRIESLLKVARSLKAIGIAPPPAPLPLPGGGGGGGGGGSPPLPGGGGGGGGSPPPRSDIYVFSGKGGRGFQSRAAKLLNTLGLAPNEYKAAQKATSAVLNAMAKDLKRAGFNVLEEGKPGLKLKNTREALVGVSPDVRGVVLNLLGTFARENGFAIKGSLGRDLGSPPPPLPPPPPSETPLNREQKLVIRTYMADKAGDPDFDTVESIKRVTRVGGGPVEDEAKQALKDVGLMESYVYLYANNLISDKQFYSRNLRINKGLIRESIVKK